MSIMRLRINQSMLGKKIFEVFGHEWGTDSIERFLYYMKA